MNTLHQMKFLGLIEGNEINTVKEFMNKEGKGIEQGNTE